MRVRIHLYSETEFFEEMKMGFPIIPVSLTSNMRARRKARKADLKPQGDKIYRTKKRGEEYKK